VLVVLLVGCAVPATAQLSPANDSGVAMGHLHYYVRDVEANTAFWLALGGKATRLGETVVVKFPDVLVFLDRGEPSGGTEGSVLNHMAFRVQSLETFKEAGFEMERPDSTSGVNSVFTPERERIELFDETATNLTFTLDDGHYDPVAERHNARLSVPIIAHHLHLYLPEGQVEDAQAWYATMFGGTPGMRWRYDAVDLPGINFNFSSRPETGAPTRGRMLDHIGLEVTNLEAFCQTLEARGVTFDVPYTESPSGIRSAFLTDPWGTYIELTEGLRGL
jgi:catechol 2,3-dioxygenase-like lactoylglutathione lyase family enzyme